MISRHILRAITLLNISLLIVLMGELNRVKSQNVETVCEHETMNLKCDDDDSLDIVLASYGRQVRSICDGGGGSTTCAADTSFAVVSSACQGQQSCSILAGNSVFGDPCVGTFKYLEVHYNCEGPVSSTTTIPPEMSSAEPSDGTKPRICFAEVSDEGEKGLISWADTKFNAMDETECPYQKSTGGITRASRQCVWDKMVGARWAAANVDDCPTDTEVLYELAEEDITIENIEEVSGKLAVVTSHPDALNDIDVTNVVVTIENLAGSLDTLNPTVSPDILMNVLETVQHMTNVPVSELYLSQRAENTSTRLLKTVDEFALGVQFSTPSIIVNTQAIDMSVLTIDNNNMDSDILFRSLGYDSDNYQPEIFLNLSTDGFEITDDAGLLQASVLLPNSLLRQVADGLERCQFVMFQDTTFFEIIDIGGPYSTQQDASCTSISSNDTLSPNDCNDRNNNNNDDDGGDIVTILNSVVISASVGRIDVVNLQEPAVIRLRNINKAAFNPRCVFWDESLRDSTGGWSQDGCQVNNKQTTGDMTVCECDHLTNFALIMDVYKDGVQLSRGNAIALSVISYIGCTVSLVALFFVLLSFTVCRNGRRSKKKDSRSGRREKRTRILLNLVVSLILVNVFYICGSLVADFHRPGPLCVAMAIILHYSLLSAMLWMALGAFDMYMSLVKIFERYYSNYLLKMSIIGWGLPVIAIAIVAGLDVDHYGYHSGLCWLSTIPFYAAFLAPVCLILMFNSFVFIMVSSQIYQLRKRKRKLNKSETFDIAAQLRASFSITILLGLTWILAIFAVGNADLVFSYLFAIVNSLQGFSLFFFQCALNADVRNNWYRTCCPKWAPPEDEAYPSDATSRRITAHQKISTTSLMTTANMVSSRISQFEAQSAGAAYINGCTTENTYEDLDSSAVADPTYETITPRTPPRTTRT